MAGRRLLDAAALLSASRSIAAKHVTLRSRQLELFSKTSSVAKAAKHQSDRVTLTFQAASALAKNFNERPETDISTYNTTAGLGQDLARVSSNTNQTSQPGTEIRIPARVAELSKEVGPESDTAALSEGHDRDVYYETPKVAGAVSSNSSRAKIPSIVESTQTGDDHVKDGQINADVYYSSQGHNETDTIPRREAIPEQDQVPDGINTDVFRTARVARMLGPDKDTKPHPTLNMHAASRAPIDHTTLAQGKDQETYHVRSSQDLQPAAPERDITVGSHLNRGKDHSFAKNNVNSKFDTTSSKSQIQIPQEMSSSSDGSVYRLRESRVPSSRVGRLWHYGGLATGMAFGAVSESFRRVTGGSETTGSLMFNAANMERLVAKLSRMRGAALKLGQMMSFQDAKMLPTPIQEVLQRVQDSADYMPARQRDQVLTSNLGPQWRELFSTFDEVPMAAASIGQVHSAILRSTGEPVAVKVQYPGVAGSIDSDLNNLSILLTASKLLPKGLYLEKTIANARTELAWECDYEREASCLKRFRSLLEDDGDVFVVPRVIDEASGKQVLTMERMNGVAVTKIKNFTQEQRDWIGTQLLRLCLREITEFKFMQTDPNWTNFLYNEASNKLELLDFGASRDYPSQFIDPYIRVLHAASINDRVACRDLSIKLGYLTGLESAAMVDAHVTSILTIAEPFATTAPAIYDFRSQSITDRVRSLIPVMLRERLSPPPEETYSLHRKLSGAFLLCARLGSRVPCRELFGNALRKADIT
ncbi:ABC1-domain-containing protein [Xylona heveae TC161]|uniref:ABC1-domain-containing protein n=1 Tax=Xylona heveae (strain CBS 132557 / TC161) TaxID=1328760 RepID=A0A165GUP8_XYLHT|nr:ABC1-domain-containing protein [Xylona heveae TC161]KZF22617.1 ABC1-domain-containing protein [Xylona heveae TC161]